MKYFFMILLAVTISAFADDISECNCVNNNTGIGILTKLSKAASFNHKIPKDATKINDFVYSYVLTKNPGIKEMVERTRRKLPSMNEKQKAVILASLRQFESNTYYIKSSQLCNEMVSAMKNKNRDQKLTCEQFFKDDQKQNFTNNNI